MSGGISGMDDDGFLRAFLDALQSSSHGTAYVDKEMGEVVVDGHFAQQVFLDALKGRHLGGAEWEDYYRL